MDYPNIDGAVIALDSETTGLKWWTDDIFGFSVSVGDKDYYWDVRDQPQSLDWLADSIGSVERAYLHHAKFDAHMFREAGVDLPLERCVCTMVRAALIDEHLPTYGLDFVGKKCIGVGKDDSLEEELRRIFGHKLSRDKLMLMLHKAPVPIVAKYAKQDTRTTLLLGLWQEDEIIRQGLEQVDGLERELLPMVVRMERHGVKIDVGRAEKSVIDIDKIVKREHEELNGMAGFEINPNPSGSIVKLFNPTRTNDGKYVLVDGTIAEPTEGGKPSIDADCLRRMKHPAAGKILRLRKLIKCRDTFLKGHVLGHLHKGRVHCNVNQTRGDNDAGTSTGRLSINNPALQQIPSRDKEVKAIVRPCFLPDDGQKWLGIDWSSFEYRWFAHYLNDQNITNKYLNDPNTDFHQVVSDMTGIPRNAQYVGGPSAKAINLSMVFGAGPGKAAEMVGLPFIVEKGRNGKEYKKPGPEAQKVFDQYHAAVPGIKMLLDRASAVARSRGYIITALGRHIRFPGGMAVHKAGGLVFQGTSADCMKSKMIEVDNICRNHGNSNFLLTVHDEIGVSVPEDDHDLHDSIIKAYTTFDGINSKIKCKIPITCDWGIGNNWYEAKK